MELALNGVPRPIAFEIDSFESPLHPLFKPEVRKANAIGPFDGGQLRFGVGQEYGFRRDVTLRVQVEAIQAE